MSYTILIQTEAVLEIREAFEWYEEQKTGLGYELIEEIEACYQKLAINPQPILLLIQFTGELKPIASRIS